VNKRNNAALKLRSSSLWNPRLVPTSKVRHAILRDGLKANAERDNAFRRIILSIPPGKVSTYGKVAAAAGYPLYHRAVARLLRLDPPDTLPWHRVLGAGGEIKLRQAAATEQRRRLRMEGVKFRDMRVDMERFEYALRSWDALDRFS
jgi:methylated-DNA-protein-cysteine methyltransferase-like protein